jgi:hypothetical protein
MRVPPRQRGQTDLLAHILEKVVVLEDQLKAARFNEVTMKLPKADYNFNLRDPSHPLTSSNSWNRQKIHAQHINDGH